ncbi:MAG TPA: XdhC family protein [Stellaceae bacterium]|nr:XdhC family protein [Stellaceae bacterium]
MKLSILDQLLADRQASRPVALVTDLGSGRQCLVHEEDVVGEMPSGLDVEVVRKALTDDRAGVVEAPEGPGLFIDIWQPPLRLIMVGAVHIGQFLAPMAVMAGYKVIIVDPREAFAAQHRFPQADGETLTLVNEWPDDAMESLKPDRRTAIVTLTHDPKIDDPGLIGALKSNAFYIGALGSKKNHAGRGERMKKAGFDEATVARIHGPVGLDINATSPGEIAVAILAQMTQILRAGRRKA